uniref:Diguanylate cyclase/phosphodiesterase n=1 Tax=Desulfovibrio desulfuricans (strain ATCC 27774 / DSM 6949 / MB) TaxID=525146 RepID=B8J1Q1_DESDA
MKKNIGSLKMRSTACAQHEWIKYLPSVSLIFLSILIVYVFSIPNPMIILMIPIVYATYSSGYLGGALTGCVAFAYSAHFFLVKTSDPSGAYKSVTIALSIFAIVLLVGKLKSREEKNIQELKRYGDALVHMATTDKLTGASNRHAFFKKGAALHEHSKKFNMPVSVLFIDIDHFKQVNDLYGHAFGDAVLERISGAIKRCLRGSDINCRYGGEEFVVLLAHADSDAAHLVAHRIMNMVQCIRFQEYPDLRLSVSIGLSSMQPAAPRSLEHLIRSADSAMYQAKQDGRNRVVVEHPQPYTGPPREIPQATLQTAGPTSPMDQGLFSGMPEEEKALMQDTLLSTLEQMLELVYVVDVATHEILYINASAREKYGIGNPRGAKCHQLLQGLDAPCSFCLNDRLTFDSVYSWEFTNKMLGRHFILRDRLVNWNGRKARMQIATDITEREMERHALQYALAGEHVTRDCIALLYNAKSLSEALEDLLERVGKHFDADRAYFFRLSGETFALNSEWRASRLTQRRYQTLDMARFHQWEISADTSEYLVIKDMEQQADAYKDLYDQGIRNLVVMPLEQNGALLGFWGMENAASEKIREIAPLLLSLRYFLLSAIRRINYEKLLVKLSFEDSLTGLHNRNSYLQGISGAKEVQNAGIAYLSINEMKRINNVFGQAHGDRLLAECAHCLKNAFPSGTAYRVGGDEFLVMCKNMPRKDFEQCVRLLKVHCSTFQDCRVAIGHQWSETAADMQNLAHAAEKRMYQDKKNHYRKNLPSDRYRHYNDDVFCLTEPGMLEKSLREGAFTVYLQPKVSSADRRVSGCEALVRYLQKDGTVTPPAQFLPVLEDTKLIGILDFYVFDIVCASIARWFAEGRQAIPISVNFSRYTLAEQDFLTRLQTVFNGYGIDKKWVIVEVTESVKGVEGMNLLALIDSIRELGFAVAIDDFGVDFANLSLFSLANFDELKVDKALVDSIVTNQKTQMVIEAVVDMCRRMNIRVVAEGVETEEQFAILRQKGCEQVQGYLFSKPLPMTTFEKKYLPGQ